GGGVGEGERGEEEDRGGAGGQLAQEGLRAPPAEHRLAAGATERRADARTLACLEQDRQDEEDADEHVEDGDREFHGPVSRVVGRSGKRPQKAAQATTPAFCTATDDSPSPNPPAPPRLP